MEDIQSLILSELRELRSDYNERAIDTANKLATLSEKIYTLAGNGQPGRVGKLETDVEDLKKWRWKMAGITTVAASAVATAIEIAIHLAR